MPSDYYSQVVSCRANREQKSLGALLPALAHRGVSSDCVRLLFEVFQDLWADVELLFEKPAECVITVWKPCVPWRRRSFVGWPEHGVPISEMSECPVSQNRSLFLVATFAAPSVVFDFDIRSLGVAWMVMKSKTGKALFETATKSMAQSYAVDTSLPRALRGSSVYNMRFLAWC